MSYKSTNCTLSGLIAEVKLHPPIYMMLTALNLNQEGNDEQLINFKKFKFKFHQRVGGIFGGFSLWFCRGSRLVWYLENANIKNIRGKQGAKK